MNRSNQQQKIDEIIGEAAFALLQQAGPITLRALVAQLQTMVKRAENAERRDDVVLALKEVRMSAKTGIPGLTQESMEQETNSHHTFLDTRAPDNRRKH